MKRARWNGSLSFDIILTIVDHRAVGVKRFEIEL
jgi:hypothetical protein